MKEPRRIALQLTAAYMAVGLAWILLSDRLVALLPDSLETTLQSIKGFLFVIVTAAVAYFLVRQMQTRIVEEAQRSSSVERMLAQVVSTVPVGVVLTADDGTITFMNDAAEKLMGVSAIEAVGTGIDRICCTETGRGAEVFAQLTRTGAVDGIEMGGRETLSQRSVLARAAQIDPSLPASGWVIALADTTESHRALAAAEHLVSGYRFLAMALSESARAVNPEALLARIAELAVESGRYSAAWAIAREPGETWVDVAEIGMGDTTRSVAAMMRERANLEPEAWHFHENEIMVSNDIGRDPANPWHSASVDDSLGSSATLNIEDGGNFAAGLTLFAPNPGEFDAPEVEMLQSLQEVISRAMRGLQLGSGGHE